MNPLQTKLLDKAKSLPKKPGCYLMKNSKGHVLYVGKAKNLKFRVTSYFNNSAKSPKTEVLVSHIRDFEFILADSETEAFVLENNLIKEHSPKYNIRMRDDKSYPYVVVDYTEPFARFKYIRRVKRKKNMEVFGPFTTGSNISNVLRIITKSFKLRDCSLSEFKSRKEACLLYQIKQCSAPCVDKISADDYAKDLKLAVDFFRGNGDKTLKALEKQMMELAENEYFEQAATIRDNIEVLKTFLKIGSQENAEFTGMDKNMDVIGLYVGDIEVEISIYIMRRGLLLGHKNFNFPAQIIEQDYQEGLLDFLLQYYSSDFEQLPSEIVLNVDKSQRELLEAALCQIQNLQTNVIAPGKKYKKLLDLVNNHAFEGQRVRLNSRDSAFVGLRKLADLLGIKDRPVRLECYDVAVFQGKNPTAAQVVFVEGEPRKSLYRHYHLKERPEGNNDFHMLKEALTRRLSSGDHPDVLIVDGGKAQVSMFLTVLGELKLDIPVVGIAKSKTKSDFSKKEVNTSEERLIIPGRSNPYILKKCPSLMRIVISMRDEAHRFSRRLHHKAHKKGFIHSWLDQVPGIGPKTKQKILSRNEWTLDEVQRLGWREISSAFEVNAKIAQNIEKYLRQNDE